MIAPAQKFYAYVVVDIEGETPRPVHVALTRKECREWVRGHPSASILRVRRGKMTLFES